MNSSYLKYDPFTKVTNDFVINQMMLTQNRSWDKDGDNGKGDAIGRTMTSYFIYGDKQFISGVKRCWRKIFNHDKIYYRGQRYPSIEYADRGFSRDHTINTFLLLYFANDPFIKELAENIGWVISDDHVDSKGKKKGKHRFVPSSWGWVKQFAGKWWGSPLFYLSNFFELILYNIQNKFLYLVGGFGKEEKQSEFKPYREQDLSKRKLFWRKWTYPIYALNLFAWQLFVMEDSIMKRILQLMAYPLVPRYNYVLKLLLNVGKVKKEDVLSYKPMKGDRWSTVLNEINNRDVYIITDEKKLRANVLDVDLLITLWNLRNPNDKIN